MDERVAEGTILSCSNHHALLNREYLRLLLGAQRCGCSINAWRNWAFADYLLVGGSQCPVILIKPRVRARVGAEYVHFSIYAKQDIHIVPTYAPG